LERERSLAEVISQLKLELKEFINTRLEMLKAELGDKMSALKVAIPFAVIGLLLAWVGFLSITAFFVIVIAMAFGGTLGGFAWAAVIVGLVYLIIGGISAGFAAQQLKSKGLAPNRTLRVLKQDQVWIQTETKKAA
jgi:uncharacterized membrane protein YqjE